MVLGLLLGTMLEGMVSSPVRSSANASSGMVNLELDFLMAYSFPSLFHMQIARVGVKETDVQACVSNTSLLSLLLDL